MQKIGGMSAETHAKTAPPPPLPAQQAEQRGLLASILGLPGDIIKGYSAAYRAIPQRVQDESARRQAALAHNRSMEQAAQKIGGMSAETQFAALTNPEELGNNYASREGVQKLSGGETALFGQGGLLFSAP